jgi:hypothetical protein
LELGQLHACTVWLPEGGHPQAPTAQVLGKSPVPEQQSIVVTDPPVCAHSAASVEPASGPPFPWQPLAGTKHPALGQLQTCTVWLLPGAQPQAPVLQVSGKSLVERQHELVETVPPDVVHSAASGEPASGAWPASRPAL